MRPHSHQPFPKLVLTGIAIAVLGLCTQASAQQSDNASSQKLDRIEITGSSIKRLATEASLPVTTLKAEEFVAKGVTTLADVMMTLPQSQSLAPSNAGSGTNINLRGLGVNRTLVLLNGRRLANEAIADGYANLDVIPFGALERVEVLRDGASSIYGSDAIGGVVNFITKSSYQGANIAVQGIKPLRNGGADERRLTITAGTGDLEQDGWNVYASFDTHHRNRLAAIDRPDLSSDELYNSIGETKRTVAAATGGLAAPANFTYVIPASGSTAAKTSGTLNPYSASGCLAPYSLKSVTANNCTMDNSAYGTLLYENEQTSLYGKGTLKLGGDHIVTAEYTRGQEYIKGTKNPTTLLTVGTVKPVLPTTSPYYPGGSGGVPAMAGVTGPLTLSWSVADLGMAVIKDVQLNQRVLLNDAGRISDWDYKAGFVYGLSERDSYYDSGYVNGLGLLTGVSSGVLNPFGLQNAAGTAYLQSISVDGSKIRHSVSTLTSVDLTLNRELMQLAGGPLSLALGGEMHRDSTDDTKLDINSSVIYAGNVPSHADSQRNVVSAFAELDIPITKQLTIDLALRSDTFSDFGNTINPKASFRYQPDKTLMFRGSANTGFRAPTLFDRYGYRLPGATTTTSASWNDPAVNCTGITAVTVSCNAKLPRATGSNPELTPETSRGFTLGFVMEPTKSLTMSLDYWSIAMDNMLANIPEAAIFADTAKYAKLFVRDSAGNLLYVNNLTMNLGGQKTAGVDVSLAYAFPKAAIGDFSVRLDGTYLTQFDNQLEKDGPWASNIGRFGWASNGTTSSLPIISYRWKHNLSIAWNKGAWGARLTQAYNSGYEDQNLYNSTSSTPLAAAFYRDIAPYSTWNLTTSYKGFKNTVIVAGVTNLFDVMPPVTNHTGYSGYLSSAGSPVGRAFNTKISYTF